MIWSAAAMPPLFVNAAWALLFHETWKVIVFAAILAISLAGLSSRCDARLFEALTRLPDKS